VNKIIIVNDKYLKSYAKIAYAYTSKVKAILRYESKLGAKEGLEKLRIVISNLRKVAKRDGILNDKNVKVISF